jgi:hypothetical protein
MLIQTQLVLISGIILSIYLFLYDKKLFDSSIVFLLAFMLASFNVNCVVKGNCNTWSWILTVMYLIYAISLIYLLYTKQIRIKELKYY